MELFLFCLCNVPDDVGQPAQEKHVSFLLLTLKVYTNIIVSIDFWWKERVGGAIEKELEPFWSDYPRVERKISTMSCLPLRRADENGRYGAKNVGARADTYGLRGFCSYKRVPHGAFYSHREQPPHTPPPPTAPPESALVGKKGC